MASCRTQAAGRCGRRRQVIVVQRCSALQNRPFAAGFFMSTGSWTHKDFAGIAVECDWPDALDVSRSASGDAARRDAGTVFAPEKRQKYVGCDRRQRITPTTIGRFHNNGPATIDERSDALRLLNLASRTGSRQSLLAIHVRDSPCCDAAPTAQNTPTPTLPDTPRTHAR